jgi:hypothetical protein
MLAQLGLAAGAAGWKAGHMAVRSGMLALADYDEATQSEQLVAYAAEQARAYMQRVVEDQRLTPAQGARLFLIYMKTFMHGALDQALDNGALLRDS